MDPCFLCFFLLAGDFEKKTPKTFSAMELPSYQNLNFYSERRDV
jgi:hypothetical protein